MAPLDIANAIRGNDLFYDFYDEPENVHRLLEVCLQACHFTFQHQAEIIGQCKNGVVNGFGVWMPGNSIGHLAEDASSMCSVDMYREFGKQYLECLLEPYDCTYLHTHPLGRHVMPDFASIDKIKFIQITYDPNQPSPIEVYKEYAKYLKDKIVVPAMTIPEIEENLDFLAEHKTIVTLDSVNTIEDARYAVELINSIR